MKLAKLEQDKWHRYEQALLVTMGGDEWSTSGLATEYQMLILPAFDAPCCLRLVLADQVGELRLNLLVSHAAELFDAIWQEHAEAEARAIRSAAQSRLEDVAGLNAEEVTTFRRRLAALEPLTLGDVNLAARDGASVRFECHDQNRYHVFRMLSPTAQEAPRHMGLVSLFVKAAQAHVQNQRIRDYLVGIRRYFH